MERYRHLFSIDQLTITEVFFLVKQGIRLKAHGPRYLSEAYPSLRGKVLANLFFEPSTRTLYSFASAALRLNMKVLNFNAADSSLRKRESLFDTTSCFVDFATDLIIIRSDQCQYYQKLSNMRVPIINGGDGTGSHPTQTLLDAMTIFEEFQRFNRLKILILGDIKHSRVAKSNYKLWVELGADVDVAGPAIFAEPNINNIPTYQQIVWAQYDVILLLRYQFERHNQNNHRLTRAKQLCRNWSLTVDRHNRLKPTAIIIHPGPVNWGWEIASELVNSTRLRIRTQVTNGFYMRAALIAWMLADGR